MSRFLVSNATIDACIYAIYTHDKTFLGYSDSDALGAALLRLNEFAIDQHSDPKSLSDHLDYRYEHRPITPMQSFKAIDCLVYQCSEGAVLQFPLYLRLRTFRDSLATIVIRGTNEYEKAQWDIPMPMPTGWESV